MGYVTTANFKTWAKFTKDTEDALLAVLISMAEKIIENYTNRVFEIDSASDQTFSRVAGLPGPSRVRGNTLYFYEELATSEDVTFSGGGTVVFLPEDGPPYYGCYLTDGSWDYPTETVNGKWGYSESPPEDIQYACYILTKWLYDNRDSTKGDNLVVTPEGKVLVPSGLPSGAKIILDQYKRVVLV